MSEIAIALAGGGPLGAIYEIGACAALAESVEGLDFSRVDTFVGVSSGAIVSSILANGIGPHRLARILISDDAAIAFEPSTLLRPALAEYARRAAMLPGLLADTLAEQLGAPSQRGVFESLARLTRALPTGLFDGAEIDRILGELFSRDGMSNDFRTLKRKLFVVATDLDAGRAVAFGSPGFEHVPISRAVQASSALPGLFPPVEIDGRSYVDGALIKTLHASVALREGARLVLCVNPLVPYNAPIAGADEEHLEARGLPAVLSQTFRAIIHSRMHTGLARYRHEYPDADVVLFEPARDNAQVFFANVFSYRDRRRLCEHAYQHTRTDLYRRRHTLAPLFERHGLRLDLAAITDSTRTLLFPRPDNLKATLGQLDGTLSRLSRLLDPAGR